MNRCIFFLLFFPIFAFGSPQPKFQEVRPGKEFQFPADHGAHPDYPLEWWYFTGHLKDSKNQTFGFELTFFRVGINSKGNKRSQWHVNSLFIAHAALTDDSGKRFLFEKRTRRSSFQKAGALETSLDVWLDRWRVQQQIDAQGHGTFRFAYDAIDQRTGIPFQLTLDLNSEKAPILQGKNGYSQKGKEVSDASYYVSFTRLVGSGELVIGDEKHRVDASAWMDHEILSSKPNNQSVGWDWFAIQLDNGYECMLYHLKRDGAVSPYSSGGCVKPDGTRIHLTHSDYVIQPIDYWKSSRTNIRYPAAWNVDIKPLEIKLQVTPTLKDQELVSKSQSTRTYWEGRSLVSGTQNGVALTGQAYVELVGYQPSTN